MLSTAVDPQHSLGFTSLLTHVALRLTTLGVWTPPAFDAIASTNVVFCCALSSLELEVVGPSSGSALESVTKILITEPCSQ